LVPLRELGEFLLPQRCPGCGVDVDPATLLCSSCLARLPVLGRSVCARCLLEERPPDACARHPGDRVHAPWIYDERVALLVHALKFAGRPGLARELAWAIAAALPPGDRSPGLVTSVPLHATRRRERGYDQAACLAEALADRLGAPFVPGVLRRVRDTKPQSGLDAAERRRNIRGAFALARPAWVRGRRVLVVDDVLTTGATLSECLALLRSAGARTAAAALAWAP
jgi:ComF family protein